MVAFSSATSWAVGVGAQRVRLAPCLHAHLGGLALGDRAHVAGVALRRRLHRGGLGPGLVSDLPRLETGGRDDGLGVALGLAAVLVGLLLGQAQDLLDAGAKPGQGGPTLLLELLGLLAELLLGRLQRLLGLLGPANRVGQALLRLGPRSFRLRQSCIEALNEVVNLRPVIAAEHDREVGLRVGVLKERHGGLRGHGAHPCRPPRWLRKGGRPAFPTKMGSCRARCRIGTTSALSERDRCPIRGYLRVRPAR
jgi:hypothetical protein